MTPQYSHRGRSSPTFGERSLSKDDIGAPLGSSGSSDHSIDSSPGRSSVSGDVSTQASLGASGGGEVSTQTLLAEIDCSLDSVFSFGSIGADVTAALEQVRRSEVELHMRQEFAGLAGEFRPSFGFLGCESVAALQQQEGLLLRSAEEAEAKEPWRQLNESLAVLDRDILSKKQTLPGFVSQEEKVHATFQDDTLQRQLRALNFTNLFQK